MVAVSLKKNFFNDTATTEIYTLSLHDALPISPVTIRHLVCRLLLEQTHFDVHLESFRAGVKLSRTTSSIEENITSTRTTNAPHNGSEPVPMHGEITRARARQF